MKKNIVFKKMLFMFLLALIVVLTACKENTPDDPANPSNPSDNPNSGEVDDGVSDIDYDDEKHNYILQSSENGVFTCECSDCKKTATFTIIYDSGTNDAYSLNENTLVFSNISENSVYEISGEFYGNIIIDVSDDYKFELSLNGFEQLNGHNSLKKLNSEFKAAIST